MIYFDSEQRCCNFSFDFVVITDNLQIPWELAFLPNGEMLITERPGKVYLTGKGRSATQEVQGKGYMCV